MLTVAYLANQFPMAVEPYVSDEIEELRQRGVCVVTGSVRTPPKTPSAPGKFSSPDVILLPLSITVLARALWLCHRKRHRILDLISRILFLGTESLLQRVKALVHTWLGAYYAILLEGRGVLHIHVHHGYFGSWIGLVAARLLDVSFSMTLHGSDLLLGAAYLDVKLENCKFCLTVSEYNRLYILVHHPEIEPERVVVSRLGVEVDEAVRQRTWNSHRSSRFSLLAVGRLHAVKDHAFLIRACAKLRGEGVDFECSIAGEGPERRHLEALIRELGLEEHVALLGHVPRDQMDSVYDWADVVVLTSRSEGIPLVLMEAMSRRTIVLGPAITGIPELVIPEHTGFLYEPGSTEDFLSQLRFIHALMHAQANPSQRDHQFIPSATRRLDWIRHAARAQVRHNFNRNINLKLFGDIFIERITPQTESLPHEDFVLQQIQLPVQRDRSVPVRANGVDAVPWT